jgi:urea carboxylase-associated protein 1
MANSIIIDPGGHWAGVVRKGETLTIVDSKGGQGVDFLCYNADQPEERYHAPNTLKAALTLKLTTGHTLYSDDARPIFTITGDTFNGHDTIGGCCSEVSNEMLYGVAGTSGCRENFLKGLESFGLSRRDIVPNINFFCDVPVDNDRALNDTVFVPSKAQAGARVTLRAEMNALAVISNCPQVNNPCNHGNPTEIEIRITASA